MLTAVLALAMTTAVSACGINRTVDAADVEAPKTTTLDADPLASSSTTTAGATSSSSTTRPEVPAPDESDIQLIEQVWLDLEASWDESVDAGLTFLEENVYPDLGLTAEGCRIAFDLGPTDTYREEVVLDEDSIEPDEDWVMPQGPLAGEAPDGTVYVMTLESSRYRNEELLGSDNHEVHVTVVDGTAYFFYTCSPTA
jgi:hypothetical protein